MHYIYSFHTFAMPLLHVSVFPTPSSGRTYEPVAKHRLVLSMVNAVVVS